MTFFGGVGWGSPGGGGSDSDWEGGGVEKLLVGLKIM